MLIPLLPLPLPLPLKLWKPKIAPKAAAIVLAAPCHEVEIAVVQFRRGVDSLGIHKSVSYTRLQSPRRPVQTGQLYNRVIEKTVNGNLTTPNN